MSEYMSLEEEVVIKNVREKIYLSAECPVSAA